MRKRMSRGHSRRNFRRNAGTHRRNIAAVMRGGYRL